MKVDPNAEKPLFLQIAEQIEDAIFTGALAEEAQVPSTNEISALLKLNPHTVLKGVNLLVEEGLLYKKRGLGMFVCAGALSRICEKRRAAFFAQFVSPLAQEAHKLHLPKETVLELVERSFEQ